MPHSVIGVSVVGDEHEIVSRFLRPLVLGWLIASRVSGSVAVTERVHTEAILRVDFPDAAKERAEALAETTIPIEEIIAGGGGEAKGTERLRKALTKRSWLKTTFVVEKRINNVPRESQSHQVDHVREWEQLRQASYSQT